MERWGLGTNSVYKYAVIHREEGPWWVFFIEWIMGWASWLFIPFGQQDWYTVEVYDRIYQWCYRQYQSTEIKVDIDDVSQFFEEDEEDEDDKIPEIVRAEHELLERHRLDQKKLWAMREVLVKIIIRSRGYGRKVRSPESDAGSV